HGEDRWFESSRDYSYNNCMSAHPDVLIIGGGVIGLTTAYFLAREGARVELVDKGVLGQEASWAGAGILPPGNAARARTPMDQLRAHSTALFPSLSAELRKRTAIDNGYLRCGAIGFPEGQANSETDEWRHEGVPIERLDEADARQLEPALGYGLGTAFHIPDMAQLRNPRHLRALTTACHLSGVVLRPGCPVDAVRVQNGRVVAVVSGQEV